MNAIRSFEAEYNVQSFFSGLLTIREKTFTVRHQWVSEFVTHPKSIIYLWLCNATRFKNSELRGIFAILESILHSVFVRFQVVLLV
jgi:hypothetical protein